MTLLIISFIAGVLTVLAPCILPLLPVVIGTSASGRSKSTPYIVVGSLAISIILFTYLLKASTAFIMIPPEVWTYISGGIIILFGLVMLFPTIWENLPGISKISVKSNKLVGEGYQKKSFWGDVLIGAGLGPVFSSCSPTYFIILASVLPASFLLGTVYLFSYTLGLALILLLIAILGERFSTKLSKFSDSRGWLKRVIAILFIILGILIVTGYEKKLEVKLLDSGFFDVTKVEQSLLKSLDNNKENKKESKNSTDTEGTPYVEIENPSGFVNVDSISLEELVGEKVILVDFMTYSCINCQRTFPYVTAWYDKYKDQGLEIIGIHTPEFAFEKDINNVRDAMKKYGIEYPVVLDNEYSTWRAYDNHYWPRKYLIDIHGNIVYDHIGEGAYEETEMKIKELLEERAQFLGEEAVNDENLIVSNIPGLKNQSNSPETYFGSKRNEYLANGTPGLSGERAYFLPETFMKNMLYFKGVWNLEEEYAESVLQSSVVYRYDAKEVYIVADADSEIEVEVFQDGKPIGIAGGEDVLNGIVKMKESRLYKIVNNNNSGEHLLELRVKSKGLRFYAFTFG